MEYSVYNVPVIIKLIVVIFLYGFGLIYWFI